MLCAECGQKVGPGARFCEACGAPVRNPVETVARVYPTAKTRWRSFGLLAVGSLVVVLMAIYIARGTSLSTPRSLAGRWEGTINYKGYPMPLILELEQSGTGYKGVVRINSDRWRQDYFVELGRLRGSEVEIIASFGGLGRLTLVGRLSRNGVGGRYDGHELGDPVSGTFEVRRAGSP